MATHLLSTSTNLKNLDKHIPVIQCHFNLIHPKGPTKKDHYSITKKVLLVQVDFPQRSKPSLGTAALLEHLLEVTT